MVTPSQPEPPQEQDDPTAKMSFFDHLVELRKRLIHSLVAIGIGLCVGIYFSDKAYDFIVRPMHKALREAKLQDHLVYLSPITPIQLYITVGLYLGIVMVCPYVFYQLWLFVAPGLYRHERRAVTIFLVSSVALFLGGMVLFLLTFLMNTLAEILRQHLRERYKTV